MALLKAKVGKLDKNFIEGMACVGGCVGGAASLNHEPRSRMKIDQYGKDSQKSGVAEAIDTYKVEGGSHMFRETAYMKDPSRLFGTDFFHFAPAPRIG